MYELSPDHFPLISHLIEPLGNKVVSAHSVMERIQRGRVYVNNLVQPTAVFLTSCGGFYCLSGTEEDAKFNEAVVQFMNGPNNHIGFFALAVFTDRWDKALDKFTILNSRKLTRSYYCFWEEKFLSQYGDHCLTLSPEYTYQALNTKIARQYRNQFYPYYKLVWDSDDHLIEHGIGHFVTREDAIISVCTSPYVGGGYAEIDIITIEPYKRKGLATQVGIQFIKECLNKQIIPNWCCHADNVESNQLAIQLCFEKIAEHPVYWYST